MRLSRASPFLLAIFISLTAFALPAVADAGTGYELTSHVGHDTPPVTDSAGFEMSMKTAAFELAAALYDACRNGTLPVGVVAGALMSDPVPLWVSLRAPAPDTWKETSPYSGGIHPGGSRSSIESG